MMHEETVERWQRATASSDRWSGPASARLELCNGDRVPDVMAVRAAFRANAVLRCFVILLALPVGGPIFARRTAVQNEVPPAGERVAELVVGATDEAELTRSLAVLRPVPHEALFALLLGGHVPAEWSPEGESYLLGDGQRVAIWRALVGSRADALRAFLDSLLASDPDQRSRVLAIEIVGRFGEQQDLRRALALASPFAIEDEAVPRALRQELTAAFVQIIARDGRAPWRVPESFESAPIGLLSAIVRALGQSEPEPSLMVAARLLGRAPSIDPLLLSTIAGLANAVEHPADAQVMGSVRPYLFSMEPQLAQAGAKASGKLEDYDAIPALIRLLDEDNVNVRWSAGRALVEITHVQLGADSRAWDSWYDGELEWWGQHADRVMAIAAYGEPAVALQAILELSRKRLFRPDLVDGLAPVVARPERQLAMTACAVLRSLRSSSALPVLLDGLDHDAPSVRAAARNALHGLTGLDLPADYDVWAIVLEGR